jgi:anaerobic magnesium-protoporphyrin IX monomethyl ester cyclase
MSLQISLLHTEDDKTALGIRCLSAALKKAGHTTQLLFLGTPKIAYERKTLEKIAAQVGTSDLIGLSCFSKGSAKAKQLAEYLKPLKKPIIWGGLHATLNPKECVSSADVVCMGEGEGFILELAEKFEKGEDWKNIANAAYLGNGNYVQADLRPAIENLDDLPLMDFNKENEFYLKDGTLTQELPISELFEAITFTGSRGCHFFCNYCSNAQIKKIYEGKGRYVRKMSVSKFVDHAESLKKRFPEARRFFFADEDFLARSVEEFREFADLFKRRVGLPFWCMGSPPQMTQEKMDLLVKAGLYRIDFGVESGSERTKKEVFNRPISNEIVLRAARIVNTYPSIIVYYFIIIGNPYEENEDLVQTINLVMKIPPPFFLRTYNLVFFPGTILFNMAVRDGIITGKSDTGFEMNILAGLIFEGHSWKLKNLYLNGILFLMCSRIRAHSFWWIPRFVLPLLIHPSVIKFNERHKFPIKVLIQFKRFYMAVRNKAGMIKALVKNFSSIVRHLLAHRT